MIFVRLLTSYGENHVLQLFKWEIQDNCIFRGTRLAVVLRLVVVAGVFSSSVLANYVDDVQICCGTTAVEAHNKVYYYEVGGYDLTMYIPGAVLLMSKLLSYGFVNVCFGNV